MPLQSLTGEDLPHAKLFVHVALTNRRGGGKPYKRGLSVRKTRKAREYTALRDLGVRTVDEVFKMAAPLLREAADLRINMQVRKHFSNYLSDKYAFQNEVKIKHSETCTSCLLSVDKVEDVLQIKRGHGSSL